MPFRPPPRLPTAAASVLAAGLLLCVASCSHLTPLGPDPAATLPSAHRLQTPIVLQAMRVEQQTRAGGCPAGYVALKTGSPGECYRILGSQALFGSAAISPVTAYQPKPPPGRAGTTWYELMITLPAAEVPKLTAVTTTAYAARGAVAIIVNGKIWSVPNQAAPLTGQQFQISLPTRTEALELARILSASS